MSKSILIDLHKKSQFYNYLAKIVKCFTFIKCDLFACFVGSKAIKKQGKAHKYMQ